jgi:transcription-repair coupling factor (superfamily II helicase)
MMEKAVAELKGEILEPEVEPEIRLDIPAYFPENYIPDANQRLLFYKRLASVGNGLELAELREEIRDRFGPITPIVENLFRVMDLRRVLKEFLVQQISVSNGQVFLLFHPESPVKVEKLLELIKKQKNRFRLAPDGRLAFTPQHQEWETLLDEVMEMLRVIRDDTPQASLPLQAVPS